MCCLFYGKHSEEQLRALSDPEEHGGRSIWCTQDPAARICTSGGGVLGVGVLAAQLGHRWSLSAGEVYAD